MMERHSHYWNSMSIGQRDASLFVTGVHYAWQCVRFNAKERPADYHRRQVWREGFKVAIKIKN